MDQLYYREYFDLERNHWWFRARYDILTEQVNKLAAEKQGLLKILNIGVSTGRSTEILQHFGEVTSLEYEQECIDYTRSRTDIEIMQGSILELPFADNCYDLVCAFDVIEHVEDDEKGVAEMSRVCRQGGVVFVTVPAYMFLWSKHDEVNHHFRRYTKNQLLNLYKHPGKFIFHSYFNFWLFFVIAPVRVLFRLFPVSTKNRKGSGSDFSSSMDKNSFTEKILYRIFKSESGWLRKRIRFPFGVSLMAQWKKQ